MDETLVITGSGPRVYQALALRIALYLYVRRKVKVSPKWTPKAMLTKASQITGRPYKRQAYKEAIADLELWIKENKQW